MGLILDGIWGDKLYEEKELTAKVVADIFKISDEIFPKNKKNPAAFLPFEYDKSKMKVVKGQQRMINSLSIPTTFTFSKNGETITITYFEKKLKKRTELGMTEELIPRKVYFGKKVTPISKEKKSDLAVYLALHHQCGTSPLRNKGSEKSYNLKDRDKAAASYLDTKLQQRKIDDIIFGGDMKVVRIHAKGVGMLGVDAMEDDTVRAELSLLFEKHIKNGEVENFINKFNAPYSGVKGQVMECLDRGYIRKKAGAAKTWIYEWAADQDEKGVICQSPRGRDPQEYFLTYMYNNWNAHGSAVGHAILKTKGGPTGESVDDFNEKLANTTVSVQDKKPSELTARELALEMISENLVVFNPASSSIHFIKSKKMEEEPFMAAEIATWNEEFIVRLENDADLSKKCGQKLTGRRNSKK